MEGEYEEDVAFNPFFITLKKDYPDLYEQVEASSLFLCIPQRASVSETQFNQDFMETHILKSGDEENLSFTTLNGRQVTTEGKKLILKQAAGFEEDRDVSILFEELFYGKANLFRIYCVDRPLEGKDQMVTGLDGGNVLLPKKSFEECQEFLRSFPENSTPMTQIDSLITVMSQHASIKKRVWRKVKDRLNELFDFACLELTNSNRLFRSLQENRIQYERLLQYIEIYILGNLHISIFCEITTHLAHEDTNLVAILEQLQTITLGDLGVQALFVMDDALLVEPVDHFLTLDDFRTPLEKVFNIKETIGLILSSVEKHLRSQRTPETIDKPYPAVSTDDLLPLFIYVIIKSHPVHLYSNLFYMKNFQLSDITRNSEMGFNFSTFQASVEYLRSPQIQELLDLVRSRNPQRRAPKRSQPERRPFSIMELESHDDPSAKDKEERSRSSVGGWISDHLQGSSPSAERGPPGLPVPESPSDAGGIPSDRAEAVLGGPPSPANVSVFHLRRSVSSETKDLYPQGDAHAQVRRNSQEGPSEKAFFKAVEEGDYEQVRALLSADASNPAQVIPSVDTRNEQGYTALHLAAVHGWPKIAEILLIRGADPNKKTRHGMTSLHLASQYNQADVVALLLKRRETEIFAFDLNGNTPLHLACSNGHVESARLLLEARANHLFKNSRGETPLHLACKWGSLEIVGLLLEKGKESGRGNGVNETTQDGNTPLHLTNNERLASLLLKHGGKLTIQNNVGMTPLHRACQTGNELLVELYLGSGAKVNAIDAGRRTPLHSAACEGQTHLVRLLIEKFGAEIDSRSKNGNTPLHAATANGKLETVSYLLQKGADFRCKNLKRQTPYDFCGKHAKIRDLYEQLPGFERPLSGSSSLGDLFS